MTPTLAAVSTTRKNPNVMHSNMMAASEFVERTYRTSGAVISLLRINLILRPLSDTRA